MPLLFVEAESIRCLALGNDNPDVALSLNNRAGLLIQIGEKEEAYLLGRESWVMGSRERWIFS
jgi:hypothetical protein